MNEFTLATTVQAPYDETLVTVRALLAEAGFGVLTEIDLQATLRAKLGVEVAPKVILGACRPELAHRALEADPRVAALLPCNVVVSATGEGTTTVEVLDPEVMRAISDAEALVEVMGEARQRLSGMLAALDHAMEETSHAARA